MASKTIGEYCMEIINLGSIVANNYLLALSNGYMLVDTGYSNGFKHFQSEIAKRKIGIGEIKYIFLTHAHDDHTGFLNELLFQSPNLKIILHPNAVAGLCRGRNSFDGGCSGTLSFARQWFYSEKVNTCFLP